MTGPAPKYDTITPTTQWALVDSRSLEVHTPWIEGSKNAVEFAHRHCRGWDLEPAMRITDFESYRRLMFQQRELPRMAEEQRRRQQQARSRQDLVQFRPFRAELKKASGVTRIW